MADKKIYPDLPPVGSRRYAPKQSRLYRIWLTQQRRRERNLFSPLSLFANGEEGAWYDPSDLTTLYQDSAGTIPVTAGGDPVGLMLDKSGNGNHISQGTSGLKPLYRTDGTLHWLEFDGFDDGLFTGALASVVFSTTTGLFCAAFNSASTETFGGMVTEELIIDATSRVAMLSDTRTTPNRLGNYSVSSDILLNLASPWDGTTKISTMRVDTSSIYGKTNLTDEDSAAIAVNFSGATEIVLGRQTAGSIYFGGNFYGVIARGGASSDDDAENSIKYLANKSGVTL